jgi:hypothetical protein
MTGRHPLALPLAFICGLAAVALAQPVRDNPRLLGSILGAALVLAVWNAALVASARRGRTITLAVAARKQHWVQALAQGSVLLYWGWYWPEVYRSAHLLVAQLLFAFAFDMLLSWSRRDDYVLGFAPVPVVFSINLFLWFKPDWFYLQFALVALGFTAKEMIRWTKNGRRVHIFNPSSFPLAVFSLLLLATGTSHLTWGHEIASTQFYPPHMYLFLFLVGLPGQLLFGVTTMTMSAVVATYLFGLAYHAATGIYFFYDSYIPIAVFLGMHLLFTDPSTSPQTDLGRIIFGALYGLSTVALYYLLGSAGLPTFYDKLLQVPLLNLSIKGIDAFARTSPLQALDPSRLLAGFAPRLRNAAYVAVWVVVFGTMSAAKGVGDDHPGQWLPFWRQACEEGKPYACPYAADVELEYCRQGSGWACNEAALMHIALAASGEDARRSDEAGAAATFREGCDLGFEPACRNLETLTGGAGQFERPEPGFEDYPIVLRGSKGPVREEGQVALYALACRQGWYGTCETASSE